MIGVPGLRRPSLLIGQPAKLYGAGGAIRTRDNWFGRPALCQLSYTRSCEGALSFPPTTLRSDYCWHFSGRNTLLLSLLFQATSRVFALLTGTHLRLPTSFYHTCRCQRSCPLGRVRRIAALISANWWSIQPLGLQPREMVGKVRLELTVTCIRNREDGRFRTSRKTVVGVAGFEPTTSRTQGERSARLSHTPKKQKPLKSLDPGAGTL